MKRLLIVILCLIPLVCYGRDEISDLPDGSNYATSTSVFPVVASGTTYKLAISDLFNIKLGTLTDGRSCTYSAATAKISCTSTSGSSLLGEDNTFTGSNTLSKVNAAGGSADALTLSGTLGIMDGSDTFRGIYLNYTNADHTGSSNLVYGIQIGGITGDAQADEYGLIVGPGWDYGIVNFDKLYQNNNIEVRPDTGVIRSQINMYDLDASAYVGIVAPETVTSSWTMVLPDAASASDGLPLTGNADGTSQFSASISSVSLSGFTASTPLASDGSGVATTLTSQNVVTTGYVDGLVNAVISTSSPVTVAGQARYYINGSNSVKTFNLPAAGLGKMYCFANALYANQLTIHPATDDIIILAGENDDTSDVVSTGVATDKICVLGLDTTYWYVTSSTGTWVND